MHAYIYISDKTIQFAATSGQKGSEPHNGKMVESGGVVETVKRVKQEVLGLTAEDSYEIGGDRKFIPDMMVLDL